MRPPVPPLRPASTRAYRPLDVHDIAQLKSLMPKLIKFAYIDPTVLQIHAPTKTAEKDKEFEMAVTEQRETAEQVLLFEFNDGELKAANRGGKTVTRRWQNRDGQQTPIVPTFTASGMTKLIDKRNIKFTEAVNELLLACQNQVRWRAILNSSATLHRAQSQDPVKLLLEATDDHVPVKPDSPGATPLHERQAGLDYFIKNPQFRPSIASIIQELQDDDDYKQQIVDRGHHIVDAREAAFGAYILPFP